uniref:Large ribosomal subunit protein bL28c n=1 Tax=Helminthora furcellata TaxID=1884666 RepID=A0A1G4NR33_9FLOR|nr:Ribosomal protein L28 [Helminthora furcellata]SCW21118.1 Ribosomal protein L28 [Helminthora furcellata]SCW23978.1 Ribosomal protein L28 [Helminthora furcellata]
MSRVCSLTGKSRNNAYAISHSHVRTKKIQHVNLQTRKIWLSDKQKWVKVKLSTKAMKTLLKSNKLNIKK